MSLSRIKFPHPLALVIGCILVVAALTYIIPAGKYDRRKDPKADNKEVVVENTYHRTKSTPVGLFGALVAIPRAMTDSEQAAPVIIYVFLVGGAFAVVERTGALRKMVDAVVNVPPSLRRFLIPFGCLIFGLGGILIQMQEELLAFVPVLLLLSKRMGYNRITVVAMSLGAAAVGAAFSPINPFQVGIAQKIAGVPVLSGSLFRIIFLAIALGIWSLWLTWYAEKTRVPPEEVEIASEGDSWRHIAVLLLVLVTFVLFVGGKKMFGLKDSEWDFPQWSALFFAMGALAGLVGGLKINGTAEAFAEGLKSMGFAALVIGFTKAISVVMDDGSIKDTIVYALSKPISKLPLSASAIGMMGLQTLLHVPVSSTSGQAAMTLPILAPIADIVGLSRQTAILAYQYGAGLCELITPTNGALMAMLTAVGVTYQSWLKFILKLYAVLVSLAVVGLVVAVITHLR